MDFLTWGTFLAALAVIAAVGAAIKAIPAIWTALKGVGRFFVGVSKIPDIEPSSNIRDAIAGVAQAVAQLSQDLKDHMAEEERMREEEKHLVENLVDAVDKMACVAEQQTIDVAEAVFKQTTFNEETPYFLIHWHGVTEDDWMWRWGNRAYLELTGLTSTQAESGQYLDAIDAADRERVLNAARHAGENGMFLEVDYVVCNISTGQQVPVRMLASPLKGRHGEVMSYLGAIHVKEDVM